MNPIREDRDLKFGVISTWKVSWMTCERMLKFGWKRRRRP
jgi:hypothetical protein